MNVFESLLLLAVITFSMVRRDYRAHGKLSRPIAILQTGFFCAYALSSYAFLDSRLSQIQTSGWSFPISLVCTISGFLIVAFSMPFLSRRSFGEETGCLRTNGLYRYSHNPQLVGFVLFVAGYAMWWPTWQEALWAGLSLPVTHPIVRGGEEHLAQVFGDSYRAYCARVPRYLGWPHH